jgi:hypothetical protein
LQIEAKALNGYKKDEFTTYDAFRTLKDGKSESFYIYIWGIGTTMP